MYLTPKMSIAIETCVIVRKTGRVTGLILIANGLILSYHTIELNTPSPTPTPASTPIAIQTLFSGIGTPIIDGTISQGEWDSAGSVNFSVNVSGSATTPATLFVMNDASNLYVALKFLRNVVDPGNSFAVQFDNNNNGLKENGDDAILFNPSVGFVDDFVSNLSIPQDTSAGGTTDGEGAFSNDGTFSIYEMSHPLKSGDDLHDFSLSAGQTVGFFLDIRMIGPGGKYPEDFGDTTFPGVQKYLRLRIAPFISAVTPHQPQLQFPDE